MDIETDEDEHSIEMHLPYVRKVFEGWVHHKILVGAALALKAVQGKIYPLSQFSSERLTRARKSASGNYWRHILRVRTQFLSFRVISVIGMYFVFVAMERLRQVVNNLKGDTILLHILLSITSILTTQTNSGKIVSIECAVLFVVVLPNPFVNHSIGPWSHVHPHNSTHEGRIRGTWGVCVVSCTNKEYDLWKASNWSTSRSSGRDWEGRRWYRSRSKDEVGEVWTE